MYQYSRIQLYTGKWRKTNRVSRIQEYMKLLLFQIWGFYGGAYEEWRLLGYKNPVRTSQETHYFSPTESSWLMLCKILYGGDYKEWRLLGCYAVWRQ
jgi:hypothetical protein